MKKRITRLAAALTILALAAIAVTLTIGAAPQDSAWGASDTTQVTVDTGTGLGATIDVTLGDSGWG
ncbi:MAG: hypothetical protein HOY79_04325 [Streptomyces sp.]|nr:hypothetical protein [Streptomyces sp.]NUS15431.1 hypothetical protein [Streptomyces sp.]NUS24111.1 hypothetical protein [Streptomyces sp.]